jgi:hypothetical protein
LTTSKYQTSQRQPHALPQLVFSLYFQHPFFVILATRSSTHLAASRII